jgi:hypothetical protein
VFGPVGDPDRYESRQKFHRRGDSGSVVVNEKNEVVGLLWGFLGGPYKGIADSIAHVLSELNIEIVTTSTADAPVAYSETTIGKLEDLLRQSPRGQAYWEAYLRHQSDVIHMFHETPRLYALWLRLPHTELLDAIQAAVADPDSKITSVVAGHDTIGLVARLRHGLVSYTKDKDLQRQADSLHDDIVNNIGRTWREAFSDRKAAS